jgi:hypothetical protein
MIVKFRDSGSGFGSRGKNACELKYGADVMQHGHNPTGRPLASPPGVMTRATVEARMVCV